jgi:hypothetical protein
MSRENRPLVPDEPVEIEKLPVKVQDCKKIYRTIEFREYASNYKRKTIQTMSTCNRMDLETLGSRPIMPRNLLGQ